MAQYSCVPSGKTVPPCPSGTAPDAIVVDTTAQPEYYPANFDHVAVQDLLVLALLIGALLIGIGTGRK